MQMRVNEPKAAKAIAAETVGGEVGQKDGAGVANDGEAQSAAAVNQHPNLALNVEGNFRQQPGKLGVHHPFTAILPVGQAFETAQRRRL